MAHSSNFSIPSRLFALFIGAFAAVLLTGCSADFANSAQPSSVQGTSLHGSAFGGQQPVSGASIYLMAAGSTGYASAAASQLVAGHQGVSVDGNGRAYVTTDAGGNWSITGDYTCNPTDEMYMVVTGGNPGLGSGASNPSLTLN